MQRSSTRKRRTHSPPCFAAHGGRAGSGAEAWDRLFASTCLLAVYTRARWADLMHGYEIFFDEDEEGNLAFVEVSVDVHKTMNASNFRNVILPLVAPARGVKDGDWMAA